MIPATNGFPFDPTDVQAGEAMRALIGDDVGLAAFTAVERELLAKDLDRNDLSLRELLGDVNGLPEATKVASRQCARTRVHEIIDLFDQVKRGARSVGRHHFPSPSAGLLNFMICATC